MIKYKWGNFWNAAQVFKEVEDMNEKLRDIDTEDILSSSGE